METKGGFLEDFPRGGPGGLKQHVKTPVALCTNVFLYKELLVDDYQISKIAQANVRPSYIYVCTRIYSLPTPLPLPQIWLALIAVWLLY